MYSAKAAFKTSKEPNQSGEYTIRRANSRSCIYKCRTGPFTGSQYAVKKALNQVSICQLPFNKLNLNINLVTKNQFENACVIQNKSTNACDVNLDPTLQPPYIYYNLYPVYPYYTTSPICALKNFNNNWNRVYYPPKEP